MSSEPDSPAEIGVLLVHGIGEQERGETLLKLGAPIVEWIAQWLDDSGQAWSDTDREDIPAEYRKYRFAQQYITRSQVLPIQPDVPPHLRFEIRASDRDSDVSSSSWLIAESRWAASFPPPNPREVIQWTMRILPQVIGGTVFTRWKRVLGSSRNAAHKWRRRALIVIGLAGQLIVAFLIAPITLVLDLLLIALLLLTFVPIPAIQRYLDWVQFKLAAIIGDSYIFSESSIRKQAVIDRVLEDLAWLEQRCQQVTILAHSQGAAVMYYAFEELQRAGWRRGSDGRAGGSKIRLLVTFGSGLAKLDSLSMNRDIKQGPYTLVTFAGVPLVALTTLLLTFGVVPAPYVGILIAAAATLVLAIMSLEIFIEADLFSMPGSFASWGQMLKRMGVHWMDIYTSSDPVPGGPIVPPDELDPGEPVASRTPEIREVHNRGSVFSDHTTYQSNADEFIPLVVTSITKHSTCSVPLHDLTPKDAASIRLASTLRRYRVKFLRLRRFVILLSMVAVLTNLQTLSDLGEATRAMLAGLRHTLLDGILGPSSSSTMDLGITNAATGFLIAALFYTLLSALFTWIWKLVDSSAVRDLTWRRTYGDLYIGRPMMLPETRKGEVRFTDFMLRLVPWLGASIAIVLAVPESESWIGAWYPSSGYPAAGQVLLLTILLAFADTIGSYWRRRGFVQQFESVPNATDSVAAAPGQDNRQDESTSQLN